LFVTRCSVLAPTRRTPEFVVPPRVGGSRVSMRKSDPAMVADAVASTASFRRSKKVESVMLRCRPDAEAASPGMYTP
jgi:hypothetical protein